MIISQNWYLEPWLRRDSKGRRQGLQEEVTWPGQRAGLREEDAELTQFLHFFHGNCSADWTLQQAEPQEGEKSGNEDLNGEKVEQRDEAKEQVQGAREEEESEARQDRQEGRSPNQKAGFGSGRRVDKCEQVGHFQVRVSWQGHLHISKGCGDCSGNTALHSQVPGFMSNLPNTAQKLLFTSQVPEGAFLGIQKKLSHSCVHKIHNLT